MRVGPVHLLVGRQIVAAVLLERLFLVGPRQRVERNPILLTELLLTLRNRCVRRDRPVT